MNIQEAVKQTLDIYKNEDEYQSIDNAMDYLLQLLKVEDEKRIKKAVYEATHPKSEIQDPYVVGYHNGWNDALSPTGCRYRSCRRKNDGYSQTLTRTCRRYRAGEDDRD